VVCIFRTPCASDIAVIKSLLEAENIPYHIDNEHFAALRGAADSVTDFGVNVPDDLEEKARDLLAEFISPVQTKRDGASGVEEDAASLSWLQRNPFLKFGFIILGVGGILSGGVMILFSLLYFMRGAHAASSYLYFMLGLGSAVAGSIFMRNASARARAKP